MRLILLTLALVCGVGLMACVGTPPPATGEGPVLNEGVTWPPVVGEAYPDLRLLDRNGDVVSLSDFRGKILLIEPIGMTCPACQAFAGAHRKGGFGGVSPQGGLESIEAYFPQYTGGVSLSDDRIVYVQLLLYNMRMGAPSVEDVRAWTEHFAADSSNTYVLAGSKDLLGTGSYNMIPGFQLVDKKFILRSDSTGHHPKHNLYTELLPMVPDVLRE